MSTQKSAKKRAKPKLIPQEGGRGALYAGGVLGNKGGTGRPPNEFKATMQALSTQEETEAYLRDCLAGKHGPKAFLGALKHCTEHGYGKPTQKIDAKVSHRVLVVSDVDSLPDVDGDD